MRLGFKKELAAEQDESKRQELFDRLLDDMYAKGTAVETAAFVEVDAVIDPAKTRQVVLSALLAANPNDDRANTRFVDVW